MSKNWSSDPNVIRKALEKKQDPKLKKDETSLTFDSVTGEVVIKNSKDINKSEDIVIDQIYKDGFFCEN